MNVRLEGFPFFIGKIIIVSNIIRQVASYTYDIPGAILSESHSLN